VLHRAGLHVLLATFALLAAGCSPELDWRELRSEDGRFVAVLPGRPHLDERELAGQPGTVMHLWTARAGGAVYGVGYLDQATANPALVARTRDALVANIAGHLVRDKEITQDSASGREFTAEGAEATLVARVLVADRRLYQVAVVGKKGNMNAIGIETFFSSFRIGAIPLAK
jgi:hypothetical protein